MLISAKNGTVAKEMFKQKRSKQDLSNVQSVIFSGRVSFSPQKWVQGSIIMLKSFIEYLMLAVYAGLA